MADDPSVVRTPTADERLARRMAQALITTLLDEGFPPSQEGNPSALLDALMRRVLWLARVLAEDRRPAWRVEVLREEGRRLASISQQLGEPYYPQSRLPGWLPKEGSADGQ